jgi:AraC family transcriptional regulator, transcriptional activator of pobA
MKKPQNVPAQFESLSDAHRAFGLPKPKHPLISLIDNREHQMVVMQPSESHVLHFYKIAYKPRLTGRIKYGQGYYDFDEGGLLFAAPGQVIGTTELHDRDSEGEACSLFTLLIHPDFFLNHPFAKKIKQYGFFSYATNETLHLSEEEKKIIISLFEMIAIELNGRIDSFSQDVVISQIELLMNHANRFYNRQFITRKAASNDLLVKLEDLLSQHFDKEQSTVRGIPTVQSLADQLHITPSYLSDMLRVLTGKNAQQHIHEKLIGKAKEMLSTTNLSVSEVAYALGFEHSQSFSKLFKTKTNLSPVEFRQSFN